MIDSNQQAERDEKPFHFSNFWLAKARETQILKIVNWAHKQGIAVEDLCDFDIAEAIESQVRNTY